MAIRNVVQVGDETLRKKCFAVEKFDEGLWQLLDDMKDTVRMEEGAGLAAAAGRRSPPRRRRGRRRGIFRVYQSENHRTEGRAVRLGGLPFGARQARRGFPSHEGKALLSRPLRQGADAFREGLFRARHLSRARPSRRDFIYRQSAAHRSRGLRREKPHENRICGHAVVCGEAPRKDT